MSSQTHAVSSRFGTKPSTIRRRTPNGSGSRGPISWEDRHFRPYVAVIKPETLRKQRFVWCSFLFGSNDYRVCDGFRVAVHRSLRLRDRLIGGRETRTLEYLANVFTRTTNCVPKRDGSINRGNPWPQYKIHLRVLFCVLLPDLPTFSRDQSKNTVL